MLNQIKIASPCSADWEQMQGNDRVRFCTECKKSVFNLSAMTRRDAEALLKEANGAICTRVFRRADGTVLTEDCPAGLRVKAARLRRRIGWAIAGGLGFASMALGQGSGTLSGRVTDQTGAPAPTTSITIIDSKTGISRETKTDTEGNFKVGSLPGGTYSVKAVSPGFNQFRQDDVHVRSIGEAKLKVTLTVGLLGEVVYLKPKPWWRRVI